MDENSWTGANKKILESELANKRYMLENIQHLDEWCEKAGVCYPLFVYILLDRLLLSSFLILNNVSVQEIYVL